jgi:hypothetical protein
MEALKKNLENMSGIIWEQAGSWLWISGTTFEHKEELKALGCRWSKKRQKWYWKPAKSMELPKTEYTGEVSEGYMGAHRWDGSNSRKHLYGADLSAALRAEFKKCNIKGVTVSCKSYTGGQSIYIKITATNADIIPYDEYFAKKMEYINPGQFGYWLRDPETGRDYRTNELQYEPEDVQDRVYRAAVKETYELHIKGCDLRENFFFASKTDEEYGRSYTDIFKPHFIEKLQLMKRIVDSYNHDDSNGQVDYFDRGFYESYYLKPLKTA